MRLAEPVLSCPACGCSVIIDSEDVWLDKLNLALHFDRCNRCDAMYLNPRMTEKESREFYMREYREVVGLITNYNEAMDAERQRRRAKVIRSLIGDYPIKAHLDIGTSRGELLKAVGAVGRFGLEWNMEDAELCWREGSQIYREFSDLPVMKFDLITAIQVLEHVNDPQNFLREAKGRLSENGRMWIEVPNADYSHNHQPWHVVEYNEGALRTLLTKTGFMIRQLYAYNGYLNTNTPNYLVAEVA